MARLGDVCTVVSGTTPKSTQTEYWDGDLNWVTPAELTDESDIIYDSQRKITQQAVIDSSLKSFPAGTVLLSSRAPIGKVAIAGTEMYCNQGFKNLICSDKIYNRYLYHFLKDKTDYLNSLGRGATFKEISKSIVENIEIPLPPLEEQRKIAAVLDKVSDLIAKRRTQLDKLDELVKSRFIEMFGMPGTDAFGWGMDRLGNACYINPKKGQDTRLVKGLDVSFVPMPAVTEHGEIDASARKKYEEVKTGFTYFAEHDVLFAKITPCMENGKGAIARNLCNGIGFGSTEFHVLRPIQEKTNPHWIYTLTSFSQFREDAANNMTGSAGQRRVPVSFLENYLVSVPPFDLQNQFADFAKQTDKSKLAVQKSLEKLEILKKALMQQYFG